MTGIAMALKAFGIQIPDESIKQIETLLPQIPALLQNGAHVVNITIQNLDIRLRLLEERAIANEQLLRQILEKLEAKNDPVRIHEPRSTRRLNGKS